jgi:peptidyl-tRNA hydrolase
MSSIWEPLAARYASWLRLPDTDTADTSDEDQDEVRAMPMVLRLEKGEPPARTAVLEAAAASAVALCLDARAQPGGPWYPRVHAWVASRIRKVARRARGAHWQAVLDLPGVTSTVDGAEVRALVPERVVDLPRVVTRLQISGSDLPFDDPPPPVPEFPVLYLNPGVPMTVGKAAAQVGHASMLLAMPLAAAEPGALKSWAERDCRCQVRIASRQRWAELIAGRDPARAWDEHRVVLVRDAGFTEVEPGTITVAAQWPQTS